MTTTLHELRECGQVLRGLDGVESTTIITAEESPTDTTELEVIIDSADGYVPPEICGVLVTWGFGIRVDASASRPDCTTVVVQ